jgi:hypothetical protein
MINDDNNELFLDISFDDIDDMLSEINDDELNINEDNLNTNQENVYRQNQKKNMKEIVVSIPAKDFDFFVDNIFYLKNKWKLDTTSDIVLKAIEEVIKDNG